MSTDIQSIAVRVDPRSDDWTEPEDFINAVIDAARRVPMIGGKHLPVEVVVSRESESRAAHMPWRDGSHNDVSQVAASILARANPRATIAVYGHSKDEEAALEWGGELLGYLAGHPRARWAGDGAERWREPTLAEMKAKDRATGADR